LGEACFVCEIDAAPLYEAICNELNWTPDPGRLAAMKSANETELAKLKENIKDAEENLGDMEVREAYLAKADYLYKIGRVQPLCGVCLLLLLHHKFSQI
jgi:26S proteasome regulatory subunit N7